MYRSHFGGRLEEIPQATVILSSDNDKAGKIHGK